MTIQNSGFNSVSLNTQIPKLLTNYSISTSQLNSYNDPDYAINLFAQRFGSGLNYDPSKSTGGSTGGGSIAPSLIGLGLNIGLDLLPSLFGDSEIGQSLGSVFGATTNSALNTMVNNVANGSSLLQGLGANAGSAAAGAAVGIGANYLGKGITSVLGGSNVAKGIGAGIASGVGRVGGAAVQNLAKTGKLIGTLGKINPYTLAANAIGEGLSAATGPSKEYGGEYGTAVQTADTIYDVTRTALGFVPVWGLIASAAMTLNKGLSNVFGSTDGQTLQDSILGTTFTPFFLKWLNMSGARTTDKFANQSWQNSEKATKFMQNSFGNLQDDFDAALKHAGKTYGLFSRSAYNKANEQVGRANNAWDRILAMADLNEWQNIRGLVMNSINNQRYSLAILGGFNQIARGKMGMKIFNNLICHNANMRMLSAAALADDIIVSAQNGTKLLKEVVVTAPRKYIAGYDSNGNPIYTENPQESMGYTPTNPKADYDKGIQAIKDSEKPKYTDPIIKAAQLGIGVPLAVTTAPATLGTLFKASEPVMNILARPTTTATKVASRLFPSLSRALPYTEMADRGLMGYLGARYTYDAGKDWYNGEIPWYQAVPQMGLSGLMMADVAPLMKTGYKRVYDLVNAPKPNYLEFNKDAMYRIIGEEGYHDALATGIVRPNMNPDSKHYRGINKTWNWFTKGHPNDREHPVIYSNGQRPFDSVYPGNVIVEVSPQHPQFNSFIQHLPDANIYKTKTFFDINSPYIKFYQKGKNGYYKIDNPNYTTSPQITAENAASITPAQWTTAQDAAIARGDIVEAQRLRDLHFKVSAPNTTIVNELGDPVHNYHGTTNTFIAFDPKKIGLTTGDKSGFFFTDNKAAANFYSHETGSFWNNLKLMLGLYKGHKPQVYDVYLNTTKPMITDFHGGVDKVGREILAKEAIKNGNDANILQNIIDGPPALPHNVTIMRNPKHIKSADAVTYDNKGVRIPLGERDNFNINDIRYSWLPWFLTGSTTAALNNKSK